MIISLIAATLICSVNTATVFYSFNITSNFATPDCVEKSIFLVNGQFPGPPIECVIGDIVNVKITNQLFTDGISVHYHGIHQINTPFYDGAAHITNDMIYPGEEYNVQFIADSSGTFFYHAHNALQDQSVFGPIVVQEPNDSISLLYDDEETIMLSDWWHSDDDSLLDGLLSSKTFRWIGEPQSHLINGKGSFKNCSIVNGSALIPDPLLINLSPNTTYRFRVINAASLTHYRVYIPGIELRIVEVEGTIVSPFAIDFIDIAPGQRYSVLLTTPINEIEYSLFSQTIWRKVGTPNGRAILRVTSDPKLKPAAIFESADISKFTIQESPNWILNKLTPSISQRIPDATKTFYFSGKQERINGKIRWTINGTSFQFPSKSILAHVYDGTLKSLPVESQPYKIKMGEVVDIIFANHAALNGICESHPWHLHGHSFYDLGGGSGDFDPSVQIPSKPILRDTTVAYGYNGSYFKPAITPGEICGWRRIRFVADNAGVWALHCHITAHMLMGMTVAIVEGGLSDFPKRNK